MNILNKNRTLPSSLILLAVFSIALFLACEKGVTNHEEETSQITSVKRGKTKTISIERYLRWAHKTYDIYLGVLAGIAYSPNVPPQANKCFVPVKFAILPPDPVPCYNSIDSIKKETSLIIPMGKNNERLKINYNTSDFGLFNVREGLVRNYTIIEFKLKTPTSYIKVYYIDDYGIPQEAKIRLKRCL